MAGGLTGKELAEGANPTVGEAPSEHKFGTDVGAGAGAVAGATLGAVGGPVGMVAGAAIGAAAGGMAGKGAAAVVNLIPMITWRSIPWQKARQRVRVRLPAPRSVPSPDHSAWRQALRSAR